MKKIICYFSILIGLTASFTSLAKEKISLMYKFAKLFA